MVFMNYFTVAELCLLYTCQYDYVLRLKYIRKHCLTWRDICKAAHELYTKFSFWPRLLSWECPWISVFTSSYNLKFHSELETLCFFPFGSTAFWNVFAHKCHMHMYTYKTRHALLRPVLLHCQLLCMPECCLCDPDSI